MGVIEGIKKYGSEYIKPLIIAIIFAMAGSIFTIVGPSQLSKITDLISKGLFGKIDLTQVMHIVVILAAIYVAAAVLSYGQGYIMATITQRFTQKLRTKITEKINNLPLQYFDTHNEGDTLSRVTNDLDTVGQSLNQSLGLLVSAVTLLLGSIVMMFTTNGKLGLTAVLSVLLGFALTILLISKSQRYFYNQQNKLADVSGYLEEIYAGHDVVKTYNYTNQAKQEFTQMNDELQTNVWKSQFLSGIMQPLMNFIGNFGYVMVSVVGALLVLKGQISIGVIVAFMIYVRLFTQPLSQITQAFTSLQSAQAAMKRVFDFLGEKEVEEEKSKQTLDGTKGNVEFDNVEFGYLPGQKIIKNFSMKAKAGQKVAIVGPTGSGKTTTVNLLMRFYETNAGNIKIDGVDIKDMKRSDVRKQFDMVLQEAWIFEDTVRNNLVYNQKNITDEQIKAATKAVDLDHFIETLPNGYDTVLDDSVSLSVGQKQLLTIGVGLDQKCSYVDFGRSNQFCGYQNRGTDSKGNGCFDKRQNFIRNCAPTFNY